MIDQNAGLFPVGVKGYKNGDSKDKQGRCMGVREFRFFRIEQQVSDNQKFFSDFQDIPGAQNYGIADDMFDMKEEDLLFYDKDNVSQVEVKAHAPWFKAHDVEPNQILDNTDWNMRNHEEVFVTEVYSNIYEKKLPCFATRVDDWAFIRIGTKPNVEFHFFFEYIKLINGRVYFRRMTSECKYPTQLPTNPVVEETCYMHYQQCSDIVDYSFNAYGEQNSTGVINCMVEVI